MPTTSTDPRAAAAALLVPGTTCHGFAVERCETVPELDSDAYVLRHTASGARLLYLACDDENKAFAIGFKTPPADSTGVFHILEHSVLCGSAKFPVKEPFVDLIKSSMQTFLNAMTYPDKTIYPVATTKMCIRDSLQPYERESCPSIIWPKVNYYEISFRDRHIVDALGLPLVRSRCV